MCRYAIHDDYKAHYACFACRKAFKRRNKADVNPAGPERPARCPQCGLLMANLGLDFQPPPRTAEKEWAVVASLWTVGITFHSCGCGGPGYRPRNSKDYRKFLETCQKDYEATLRSWLNTKPPHGGKQFRERENAIAVWTKAIDAVKAALSEEP
jgi:hypothetical protein